MKTMKNLTAILFVAVLLVLSSCGDDEEVEVKKPVLNENLTYTVTGNTVSFSTTLSGNVWVTKVGVDYFFTDKARDVIIPLEGTHTFTCSVLDASDGLIYTSDPFDVTIATTDLTYFDTDYWKKLTGGFDASKTWVLDLDAKLHEAPMSFYGTGWDFVTSEFTSGDSDLDWYWDPATSWVWEGYPNNRMWEPGTEGYGSMTFSLEGGNMTFIADKKKEPAETGSFSIDWDTRSLGTQGATILRSYKPTAYTTDEETHLDTTWNGSGLEGFSNWYNTKILSLTDSVLRLAVLRDQDVDGEGECWVVYNFVETNVYDTYIPADEQFTYSEENSINTAFTQEDLVGTWKYADVPQGWIAFAASGDQGTENPAYLFGGWDTRDQVVTDITSWGATDVAATFAAADANEYIFNADGSCSLNGVANTYTYADGVITFGTALTNEIELVWLTIAGTELKVIDVAFYTAPDVAYTPLGTWFGQKNGAKDEFSAVQWVKQ